jgi:hypothetical protein
MSIDPMRLPQPINKGKHIDSAIGFLKLSLGAFLSEGPDGMGTVTAERYACGYPLPPFQRDLVWTQAQEVAFVESAWLGLPLGTFCVHEIDWEGNAKPKPFSGWLIDGQQRLTALERYWCDEFPIMGFYWSELNRREKRRFEQVKFTHYQPSLRDESAVRDLYNRLALGGTPHREDQRA